MKQLNPKSVWLFFASFVVRWFIPFGIFGLYLGIFLKLSTEAEIVEDMISFSFPISFPLWFWAIMAIFLFLCFGWAKLTSHFYRYEVADMGFRKESGVIYKRYVTIPYDRIQNVDIHRGILARLLGLSDLQIQTAGASAMVAHAGIIGGGAEGRLPGLSREVAEQLRDELIVRTRRPTQQGL